jgi:hypothetical protein
MASLSGLGPEYLASLTPTFAEYVEHDATHEINEETRATIDARLREFPNGDQWIRAMQPDNYKPRAANILLSILADEPNEHDLFLITRSNILNLYYTGYLPRDDGEFERTIWPNMRSALCSLEDRQRIVANMHKTMNPGPPAKKKGGSKRKKNKKRSRRYKKT